jgi:hypothetical protein
MTEIARAGLVVSLIAALAGCGGHAKSTGGSASATNPSGSRELVGLREIAQLQSMFNSRSGEPRLILLVSPT